MKRKITIILAVVLMITALTATTVFASGDRGEETFNSMFDAMRRWSQETLASGEITEEEAERWERHFEYMEKFHRENGFGGHCRFFDRGYDGNYGQEQ